MLHNQIVGNTISEVLELTQYYRKDLLRSMKEQINEAIKSDRLKPNEGMRLLAEYEKGKIVCPKCGTMNTIRPT